MHEWHFLHCFSTLFFYCAGIGAVAALKAGRNVIAINDNIDSARAALSHFCSSPRSPQNTIQTNEEQMYCIATTIKYV